MERSSRSRDDRDDDRGSRRSSRDDDSRSSRGRDDRDDDRSSRRSSRDDDRGGEERSSRRSSRDDDDRGSSRGGSRSSFQYQGRTAAQMKKRGEIRKDINSRHLIMSCVAMAAFPYQEEMFVRAIWLVEWDQVDEIGERHRQIVDMILARILP
jgi:hypothetical protein